MQAVTTAAELQAIKADPERYERHKAATRAAGARYRARHPERVKRSYLQHTTGCTPEQYDALVLGQAGLCAVCNQGETTRGNHGKPRLLAVDHDHVTGKVRGLVCHRCNAALGLAGDDPARLRRMAEYLEEHR